MNAIDTNILVYAVDHSEPVKRPAALALIDRRSVADTIIPWQVLCEFAAVMIRFEMRGAPQLAPSELVEIVQKRFPVILPGPGLVLPALRLRQQSSLSFWDAMLVAGCAAAGADRLYTEDLQTGGMILGVEVVNPFMPSTREID